jgi:hypothetical protein
MYKALVSICLASVLFLVSCSDDTTNNNNNTNLNSVKVTNFSADTSGQTFKLFSFKNNAVVPVADSATTKWDIGFKSTSIIVNSTPYGPGQAGIQLLAGTDFATLKIAPDAGYNLGSLASSSKWYNYNPDTHIISAVPGVVIALKTADGKYVKMRIISYYKDNPATPDQTSLSRFYTFEYVYQPDGSKNF